MWFELLIALHYLRPKGTAGIMFLFSLIGVILGVATLTVTTAVMNGFRLELINSITGINGHINLHGSISQEMITDLRTYEDIECLFSSINSQAMISSKQHNTGIFIRGVESSNLRNIEENIISGGLGDFHNGLLIGKRLAENLMVKVGDRVDVFLAQSTVTMIGNIPRMKTYPIVGIFDLGMFEYDNMLVYMPLDMARKFFRYDNDNFNNVDIHIKDPEKVDILTHEIKNKLNISAISWKERGGYLEALETEKSVMFLILTMIILVASFNIVSSLIMLVQNKKGEVAILRTIGATRNSIMRIFLICGGCIGIFGTACGLLLGVMFANNIETIKIFLEYFSKTELFNPLVYFFEKIPSVIILVDIVKISIMSLMLSFFAAIIPAIKAAKHDPSQVLRME